MVIAAQRKPFVIPIFIPHAGCPHRCVFCNQPRTCHQPEKMPTRDQLDKVIQRYLGYRKDADRFTEISFFGGNFLGLSGDQMQFLLESASLYVSSNRVQGIRFSTRPETVTPNRLNRLDNFPISTIEIGVQSMNEEVLLASRRGHSAKDVYHAVKLLKQKPYRLGLQMMVGLPGDTFRRTLATGRQIADLKPSFVRIYPTLVLVGSLLADWYKQGRFVPMPLEKAVDVVKKLYMIFDRKQIKVIRMGLQATEGLDTGTDLVAGPFHPAFGELVYSALWLDAMRQAIRILPLRDGNLIIELHPNLVSRVQGQKHLNLNCLHNEFRLRRVSISTNSNLALNMVRLNGQACQIV